MPEISRFFGMVIAMYFNDHDPPHFHVRYGLQRAIIAIDTGAVLASRLGPRALGLIAEWRGLHRETLLENWRRAREHEVLTAIPPLE